MCTSVAVIIIGICNSANVFTGNRNSIISLILLSLVSYYFFDHVQKRVETFINPLADTYQIDLSLKAFKSGGLFGKGPGQGILKEKIPDASTDFIFAVAGEEHPGVDIAIPGGSYVRAVGSGTVGETGHDLIYGNFVVIDHGTTYQTRYAHVSLILVADGDPVRRNEVIALSGSSGRSTAPHLHFEVIQEGVPIDPLLLVTQP